MKHSQLTIIIPAICAVALFAVFCADPELNNPFDSKSSNYAPYTLTTNANPPNGGNVTRSPNRNHYRDGEQVRLTAEPADDYRFTGWSDASIPAETEITVTINGDVRLTANFEPLYQVIVNNGNGSGMFAANDTVYITAEMYADGQFVNWTTESDGVHFENAESETTSFIMPSNTVTVIANVTYPVTVEGGTGSGSFVAGETITITAEVPDEHRFDYWSTESEGVTFENDSSATTTFTMPPNAVTITANHVQIHTLAIIRNPTNGGSITVNGTAATSVTTHDNGTSVTVEAIAESDYLFTGWTAATKSLPMFTQGDTLSFSITFNIVEDVSITANFEERGNRLFDYRDGKIYRTVIMPDGKEWMAENLNYVTASGSWCYGNSQDSCAKYGRLYDWATAMGLSSTYNSTRWNGSDVDHQGVCPASWRLPDTSDWGALERTVGGYSTAGTKLKSTSGWYNNGNGTDDYGFSALPGGNRWDGSDGIFHNVGGHGFWWTATEDGATSAWNRYMGYGNKDVFPTRWYNGKTGGFSVRCVKR